MKTINLKLHKQRKLQILEAATQCFIKKGFHQSGMREICAQAKLSSGAVYNYFKSKDEIIAAIAEIDRADKENYLKTLDTHDDFIESLINATVKTLELSFTEGYGVLAAEIFAEASRNPAIASLFEKSEKLFKVGLAKAITDAQRKNTVNALLNAESAAETLLCIIDGFEGRTIFNKKFDSKRIENELRRLFNCYLA